MRRVAAIFAVFALAAVPARPAPRRNAPAASDQSRSLIVSGLQRHYLLHVPSPPPAASKPLPLVLVFHGGGGSARRISASTGFDSLADRAGFLVAYPDGIGHHWNDGRGFSTAGDVAFVRALLDDVERSHPVDVRRVFAAGVSNGGFFANRLACQLSGRIAAIASVSATMPETLPPVCRPARPVSVLYIQGDADPLVPIGGGKIGFRRGRGRGRAVSLAAASSFWRRHDGITSPPRAETLPVRVNDGTRVRLQRWSGGRDGTEVVVYTIEGGGHGWPGRSQYLPRWIVGTVSANLDATQTIWEFFRSLPLR